MGTSSKRPWRALGDSKDSQSQPQDNSNVRQARPQAVAKAQSIKSTHSDQRSVQLHSDQRQVQLRAPQDQANFPVLAPQGQGHRQGLGRPVVARRDDLDSLFEEEFSVDLDNEAVLKEKQARSKILDKVAEFCNLDRQDPRIQKEVMGMRLPVYNAPAKKSIEISLPWHSSTIPIAYMNHEIVRGKLNKSLKPQNPSKPWSPKDFFGGSGYYVHNTQGYLAKPDSLVVPSRPPPAERTAEDEPFFHVPRNPEDPRTRVDISSGSASLTASQLLDQETMSRKSAAAASTALSIAEFIDNYPGMPEGARAAMLLLKLDIVSFLHYTWREVHNKMLLRRSIALDCLERTLPPIDEDQKLALLHAPFKGTTLFGGELAKLQEANTKRAATFTMFPQPTAPSTSYSARPYVGLGKSFTDKKGFRKPGGKGRDRAGPHPPPRLRDLASPRMARKPCPFLLTLRNAKLSHRMIPLKVLEKPSVIFEEIKTRVTNNEGVLPPHVSLVGGRLSNFVEGWKRITNDPYVLSIVAKGYRLRFTSLPLLRQAPWEIRSPQDPQEILGMREQISLMLQKNAITEVPPDSPGFYSNVFLVRKASGGWRPVIDLKNLNAHIHAPHFRMFTTSSVLSSVEKEFRVQD